MSPIIKWEPFEEMDKMFNDLVPLFGQGSFAPAVDVYQTDKNVVVETALVGVDPNDVEISIDNDILFIRGENKKESEVDEKDYYRKEIRQGSFQRSVVLPSHVDSEKAKAEARDGMLTITIPKVESKKVKPIKIEVKKGKK
jgi:HSP20 family protein